MENKKYTVWYKTGGYGVLISTVNAIGETEKFITIEHRDRNGKARIQRESKESNWSQYHRTFEDAKAFLISGCQKNMQSLEAQLKSVYERLAEIHAFTESDME